MTREEFEYAIKSCGCFIYRGQTYYEESELMKAFEDMGLIEQEPKYCDRNICLRNEYNGIGCEECEVAKSQESCEDAISREAVLQAVSKGCQEWRGIYGRCEKLINALPSVKPQEKTGHWTRELIRNEKGGCIGAKMICSRCDNDNKHDEYMNYCPNCGAKMD